MNREEKELIMRSVVSSFCVNKKMFTSVEVANHLKRLGVWIRNRYVGEYLRENVASISGEYGIEYARTNVSVDNTGSGGAHYNGALCHHPIEMSASTYMSRDLKAITPDEFEARHGVSPFDKKDEVQPLVVKGETVIPKKVAEKHEAQFSFVAE